VAHPETATASSTAAIARAACLRPRLIGIVPDSRFDVGAYRLDVAPWKYCPSGPLLPQESQRLAAAPIVFCRNVFIYFSAEAIRRTVHSFAEQMPTEGHLFVGASESLLRLTNDFTLDEIGGAFVYLKKKPEVSTIDPVV